MAKGGNGGGGGKPGGGKPGGGGGDSEWTSITGNKRDNLLIGTEGKDAISGKDGDDTLYGGGDDDLLLGGNGNDIIYGEAGADRLHGGNGDDSLFGGLGVDTLQGGAGADRMDGGGDYDIAKFVEIDHGLIFDTDANPGNDTDYTTSDGDSIVRVEEIIATNYNDIMNGGGGDDYFVGARGEDTLYGNAGDDTLYGSLDDDIIYAGESDGSGSDTLIFLRYGTDGNPATDDVSKGDGVDVVYGFTVGVDNLVFLSTETFFTDHASFEDLFTLEAAGTRITYGDDASVPFSYDDDSSILLVGIFQADWTNIDATIELI